MDPISSLATVYETIALCRRTNDKLAGLLNSKPGVTREKDLKDLSVSLLAVLQYLESIAALVESNGAILGAAEMGQLLQMCNQVSSRLSNHDGIFSETGPSGGPKALYRSSIRKSSELRGLKAMLDEIRQSLAIFLSIVT
jgi:hypothetical protein